MKLSLIAVGAAIAASVGALTFAAPRLGGDTPTGVVRPAPEFQDIEAWLNSPPLNFGEGSYGITEKKIQALLAEPSGAAVPAPGGSAK